MKNLFKFAALALLSMAVVALPSCSEDETVPELSVPVATDGISVPAAGVENQELNIETNVKWTAAVEYLTEGEDWVHVNPAVGTAATKVTFSVDPNETYVERTATIVVSVVGLEPIKVKVTQAAAIRKNEIVFGTTKHEMKSALALHLGDVIQVYFSANEGLAVEDDYFMQADGSVWGNLYVCLDHIGQPVDLLKMPTEGGCEQCMATLMGLNEDGILALWSYGADSFKSATMTVNYDEAYENLIVEINAVLTDETPVTVYVKTARPLQPTTLVAPEEYTNEYEETTIPNDVESFKIDVVAEESATWKLAVMYDPYGGGDGGGVMPLAEDASDEWITLDKTEGKGNDEVTVTLAKNDEYPSRTAIVYVVPAEPDAEPEMYVEITQKGKPATAYTVAEALAVAVEAGGDPVYCAVNNVTVYGWSEVGLVVGDNTGYIFVEQDWPAAYPGNIVNVQGSLMLKYETMNVAFDMNDTIVEWVDNGDENVAMPTPVDVDALEPLMSSTGGYDEWITSELYGKDSGIIYGAKYITVKGNYTVKETLGTDEYGDPNPDVPGDQYDFITSPYWKEMGAMCAPYALYDNTYVLAEQEEGDGVILKGWVVGVNMTMGYSMMGKMMGAMMIIDDVQETEKIVGKPAFVSVNTTKVALNTQGVDDNGGLMVTIENLGDNVLAYTCDNSAFTVEIEPFESDMPSFGPSAGGDSFIVNVSAPANTKEEEIKGNLTLYLKNPAGETVVTYEETIEIVQEAVVIGTQVSIEFASWVKDVLFPYMKIETDPKTTPVPFTADMTLPLSPADYLFMTVTNAGSDNDSGYLTGWHNNTYDITALTILKGTEFTIHSQMGATIKKVEILGNYYYDTNFTVLSNAEGTAKSEEVEIGTQSGYAWVWTGKAEGSISLRAETPKRNAVKAIRITYAVPAAN